MSPTAPSPAKVPRTAKIFRPFGQDRLTSTTPIREVLAQHPELSTYLELATTSGLLDEAEKKGPYTLLAPDNTAFAKMPPGYLTALRRNHKAAMLFLRACSAEGVSSLKTLTGLRIFPTLTARRHIVEKGDTVVIDGCKVIKPNIQSKTAVIHVVDKVPMPPQAY